MLVHWIVRRVPTHPAREFAAVATGAAIGLGSAWFEHSLVPRVVRALTVGGLLLVRTFFYVVLCAIAIHVVTMSLLGLSEHGGLLAYYTSAQYRDFLLGGRFGVALVILTLVSFLINFVRQLDRMLGPGTLLSLMLGRYHRPVAEERIFMFLDLNSSTAIAEALGPLRFNDFKNDFFHDLAEPVLETRGQIYQYVGDEARRARTPTRQLPALRVSHERGDPRAKGSIPRPIRHRARIQGRPTWRSRRHRGDRRHQEGHRLQWRHREHRSTGRGAMPPARASGPGVRGPTPTVSATRGTRNRRHGRAGAARQGGRVPALQPPGAQLEGRATAAADPFMLPSLKRSDTAACQLQPWSPGRMTQPM